MGFRPAVYRLAEEHDLAGVVRNDADGASIEVEGPVSAVASFLQRLPDALPALASLDEIEIEDTLPGGLDQFRVEVSRAAPRRYARIPPDTSLCVECRRELDDPDDRRHRYPFITCTHCGPRFSLVRGLPYDRERTAMDRFPLCPACLDEYTDPGNRRFHAEPTCCHSCGPRLWIARADGQALAESAQAMAAARDALAAGKIVAVKGLGGFQLACRADRDEPVQRLRASKQRASKPFAVMVPDLGCAREIAEPSPADEALLSSARAPIVLLPKRAGSRVAAQVAPGIDDIGLMLPTTPLHVELFREAPYEMLVMTSGNAFDEPIARENDEALRCLADFAHLFLLHDREVVRRVDDSVVRSAAAGAYVLRRSRGYTPDPLDLPFPADEPVLALGAHLQNAACLAVGNEAFPSQHVGDLDTDAARGFLLEVASGLEGFLEVKARVVAVDLHPDYPSRWLGEALVRERGGQLIPVQHHLAHAAAVLGEHRALPTREERAAALVLDGTGLGTDGTAWGCEWLVLSGDLAWQRLAHGSELALVGGEQAVREPWRVLVAALVAEGAGNVLDDLPLAKELEPAVLQAVGRLATAGDWPRATGAGRVFEAAGALLGVGLCNRFEGECAARLEALASRVHEDIAPWPEVVGSQGVAVLPTSSLLVAAARRRADREDPARIARGFHDTFCRLAAEQSARVLPPDVSVLALAGGCLANRLLREGLRREHEALGLRVLLPRELPPGDGGIAYGQAVLAAATLGLGQAPRFEGVG
ncbi:MAG: carbamoyltransferase HypF [bacterium]|nr:carbamoyltransferase HypF [bacterium]